MAGKLTKKELVRAIAADLNNVSAEIITKVMDATVDRMVTEMKAGNEVTLVGIGTFSKVTRAARNGINPKTMEKIKIAAKGAPKFKASKTLKEALA